MDPAICDQLMQASRLRAPAFQSGIKAYDHYMLDHFGPDIYQPYIDALFGIIEQYKQEFSFCYTDINRWGLFPAVKVQRYAPGRHYAEWHCENGGLPGDNRLRHLVFMTFLNDIEDEGGTEFFYQKIKVQPQKGLTLIWPADWTHTHRGVVSPSEEKFIVTGWWTFAP
jgi:hypothetical protein